MEKLIKIDHNELNDFLGTYKNNVLKPNPQQMTESMMGALLQFGSDCSISEYEHRAKYRLRYGMEHMKRFAENFSEDDDEGFLSYDSMLKSTVNCFEHQLLPHLDERLDLTLKKLRSKNLCTEKCFKEITNKFDAELFSVGNIAEYQNTFEQSIDCLNLIDPKAVKVMDEDWKRTIEEIAAAKIPEVVGNDSVKSYARQLLPYINDIYTRLASRIVLRELIAAAKEANDNSPEKMLKKIDRERKKLLDFQKKVSREAENLQASADRYTKRMAEADEERAKLKQRIKELESELYELKKNNSQQKIEPAKILPAEEISESKEKEYRRQIAALNLKIDNKDRIINSLSGGSLLESEAIDAYPGEQKEFLLYLLEQTKNKVNPETRAYDLITSLIRANKDKTVSTGKDMLKEMQGILTKAKQLSDADIKQLKSLGFDYIQGGKHGKCTYQGKYMVTLSVSPSDHRTAQQRFIDMSKAVAVGVNL